MPDAVLLPLLYMRVLCALPCAHATWNSSSEMSWTDRSTFNFKTIAAVQAFCGEARPGADSSRQGPSPSGVKLSEESAAIAPAAV
ncbi:hypothetical protein OH77DRAFT_1418504 [Trametes cingulata]|nr:hypothetical protein OH77DRAFT_1418504 [Trametes cingulata]